MEWLRLGRRFSGLIAWQQEHHARMSVGQFIEEFETLASTDDPFAGYPIIHLKPSRSGA